MKNFITVAALLAAGSAFANADPINVGVTWPTGSGATSTAVRLTDQYGFDISLSQLYDASSLTAASYSVSTLSVGLTSGSDVTNSTYWSAGASGNASLTGSVTGTYVVVADVSNNILAISSAGTAYSGQVYYQTPTSSTSGKALVRFSFEDEFTLPSTETLKAYFVSSTNGLTVGETLSVSDGKAVSNSAKTSIVASTSNNNTPCVMYTMTAVPEPSAFGLLAGAGALALVAARRRRRAK